MCHSVLVRLTKIQESQCNLAIWRLPPHLAELAGKSSRATTAIPVATKKWPTWVVVRKSMCILNLMADSIRTPFSSWSIAWSIAKSRLLSSSVLRQLFIILRSVVGKGMGEKHWFWCPPWKVSGVQIVFWLLQAITIICFKHHCHYWYFTPSQAQNVVFDAQKLPFNIYP